MKSIENELVKNSRTKGFMSRDCLTAISPDYYYLWMAELQKWLRDKEIKIVIDFWMKEDESKCYYLQDVYADITDEQETDFDLTEYATYEHALEAALMDALILV